MEHGLKNDRHFANEGDPYDDCLTSFFAETKENEYVPRSLFIDLEPTAINEVKRGINGRLFLPEQFISGKEDAASNYARGYYSIGNRVIDESLDKIRKIADNCTGLQGFFIFDSVGGGTGSGFGSLLLENLSSEYPKKTKFSLAIYPSPKISTSVLEPYNSVLATHQLREYADVVFVFDNDAINDICKQRLYIYQPSYTNLNNIIAQVASAMTASIRYESYMNTNLHEFQTNLAPYPRMKFMLSSYAPFLSSERVIYEIPSVSNISESAFEASSMMAKCDPREGRAISYNLMYRGDVVPKDVSISVNAAKAKGAFQYSNQYTNILKCGTTYSQPMVLPGSWMAKLLRSVLYISNNSAITKVFSRINKDFDTMYRKQAFLHWYCREGMEKEEFCEARHDITDIEKDYEEL
ncbi:unnamed protein product [Blepharisma stoltei]|uniref:Tubulin alpha chain n=1 Tax=Blepharisma stoltei TaxID=1481888 RepID=A0AAU9JBX9_9CILI|nr:unnamed protein product [Blepharisma stoltei]